MLLSLGNLIPTSTKMAALQVDCVDFHMRSNRKLHHTKKFEVTHSDPPVPVLRRGQAFQVSVTFKDRPYQADSDVVRLVFRYGTDALPRLGNRGIVTLTDQKEFPESHENLAAILKKQDGNTLYLQIRSPVTAPVGCWYFEIHTTLRTPSPPDTVVYKFPEKIYLLFNPWSPNDGVYMPEEHLLEEYVLSQDGKIWKGDAWANSGRSWMFGQFDALVLPACMLILNRTKLTGKALGDPVKVSRALTKLVNSNEGHGVLVGRWDGYYPGGTAPSAWTGSVPILEQFLRTGRRVKYGQCWVFAGVLTTLCRALGIPSRPVTNFNSAHDTDNTLTIDKYYFPDNEEMPFAPTKPDTSDSIWNFHVWNDAWMARPDLPEGNDGWQAVDATPQETSDGFFQCGPAPVAAVRRGDLGFNFDVNFVLAEVHAQVISWMIDPKTPERYTAIESHKNKVGKLILTKKPNKFDNRGERDREDITHQYKAMKGTEEHKACSEVLKKAMLEAGVVCAEPDVEMVLHVEEHVNIGDNINITVNIQNKSEDIRKVTAALSADTVYYNGEKGTHITKLRDRTTVWANSNNSLKFFLDAESYLEKLVEYSVIKFYIVASVEETKQIWVEEHTFQLAKPSLIVTVNPQLRRGEPATVTFQFKNPFKKPLSSCRFMYEGTGLCSPQTVDFRDIAPMEEAELEMTICPEYEGDLMLVAAFESRELSDIHGSAHVTVLEG